MKFVYILMVFCAFFARGAALSDLDGKVLTDGTKYLAIYQITPKVYKINYPKRLQYFQRDESNIGHIKIEVYCSGLTGTLVEARQEGSEWQSVGFSGLDGFASGYLLAPVSQGRIDIRAFGETDYQSIDYVSVGDIFHIWGQSNGSGRGTHLQPFVFNGIIAGLYGNDEQWREIVDPTDNDFNQIDTISDDFDSGGMGSIWPIVASQLTAQTGVPVAFVQSTKGATVLGGPPETNPNSWTPGTDHFNRNTLFGSAMNRIREIGGARAVLWWQGESGFDDQTGNSYVNPFNYMVQTANSESPGIVFMPCKLQECPGVIPQRMINGWHAIQRIWDETPNVVAGPTLGDYPIGNPYNLVADFESSYPAYHLKSDYNLQQAANRWVISLIYNFYETH